MEHITVGKKYNEGKVAFVECQRNGDLSQIDIKDKCFLLVILTKGRLSFTVGGEKITAAAPAFLCFDESENPKFTRKTKADYTLIYFYPKFLNINMTFERLRSQNYEDIATTHDMFMLKPFIDKAYVIPIVDTQISKIEHAAESMRAKLLNQRDWYWSCRGRSYFMQIIITLERMYGLIAYGFEHRTDNNLGAVKNPKLRDAVLYIEGHYSENLNLKNISSNAGINHTTLTVLMKEEFGCTAIEYLMNYRISVAKKELAFTDVPVKDIANMVGFKTVQHFTRIFKEITETTPAEFRKISVKNRKEAIK